ncbi:MULTISPECIES: hydroxymethylglutaryl-CoA synthase [unclassified Pseudomonas]|uniref:hydroxymethylglutaryl-CoA synthase n=1 Tax=unclassified Pseudomonas TaxID=196821 RepID=UPI0008774F73|nr:MULTISPECIES: hydroxymethylglutaryl-CoA synthase [unclassified Pseudomonas]SCZ70455.1 hydroxymethylglutaryl-CoA synthase [Pseudomonas sp. NFPP17]SDA72828.1 hydroxymethylglutaryl-CoA synthase [Pseudomonas sp. NFPP15]SEL32208.1 hydroxymethylglutaryl-CoA synthase [Pseudomonas sp. NFPP18]SFA63609.1 hydroxymethylglutaryl-CoA synthase [Pseudomonas sp. NFPP13]SFT90647.1 hydroxymethylglutaryl-CoA synthase [Pseudomonas sp. NFPP25]
MNVKKIGIVSYGAGIPVCRLKVQEVINVWKNTDLKLVEENLGVTERAVLQPDEDVITLGVLAAQRALDKVPGHQIEALYLGTCTNPYDSRASASIILEMLGSGYDAYCADVQFAGKSGTSALQICQALVASGMTGSALAIGADTINRNTAPGDLTESYAGAGAAALLIGSQDVIAEFDASFSCAADVADNIRPQGDRYIRSGMGLGSDKNSIGLEDQTRRAAEGLMAKLHTSPADYDYVVFQQNLVSTPYSLAKHLGFNPKQVEPGIYAGNVGDAGSASPLLGLINVLDRARPGQKILLVSYGFGAGSDAIALTVTDAIEQYQKHNKPLRELLESKIYVDYGTSIKYEFKYLRADYALTAYL